MLLRKLNLAVSIALFLFVVKCHGDGGSDANTPITSKGTFTSNGNGESIVSKSSSSERSLQLLGAFKGLCPAAPKCGRRNRGTRIHRFRLGGTVCVPGCVLPRARLTTVWRSFKCGACPKATKTTTAPTNAPVFKATTKAPVAPLTKAPVTASTKAPMSASLQPPVNSAAPVPTPTAVPLSMPNLAPVMTPRPTTKPTVKPSAVPSVTPSEIPSVESFNPTEMHSIEPSAKPSVYPSTTPSVTPSLEPSTIPSIAPTNQPSAAPSKSLQPSSEPSNAPSMPPSAEPSFSPSGGPSAKPSQTPTGQPSASPSNRPSVKPSASPTEQPSAYPSSRPSAKPSFSPSNRPSAMPSQTPSKHPSTTPSQTPTGQPSASPSKRPSVMPSQTPTGRPSVLPSNRPSGMPSQTPSQRPSVSHQPSTMPSQTPSQRPSISHRPSTEPSTAPSAMPSVTGSVIISEVFFQEDYNCHWIEIYNQNGEDVDLSDFTLTWKRGSANFTFPADASIPSKQYRLLGFNNNVNNNCGVTIDFVVKGSTGQSGPRRPEFAFSGMEEIMIERERGDCERIKFADDIALLDKEKFMMGGGGCDEKGSTGLSSSDTIVLKNKGGFIVDSVAYSSGGSGWPSIDDDNPHSLSLKTTQADNNAGSNWCASPNRWFGPSSRGIKGTPRRPNDCGIIRQPNVHEYTGPMGIIITEIMVNPIDADDKTEWFEIFNASPDSVNMTGWTIQEATIENTHTMSSFVIGSGQYKVLGRQTNIAGVTVDYVYGLTTSTEGYPQLDNTGDYLLLRDAFTMQDSVNFWSGSNFPGNSESFNAGKSMQLKSLALDNFDGANWCRSTTAWSGAADGDMGTPGQANDCPLNPPPSDSDAQA